MKNRESEERSPGKKSGQHSFHIAKVGGNFRSETFLVPGRGFRWASMVCDAGKNLKRRREATHSGQKGPRVENETSRQSAE